MHQPFSVYMAFLKPYRGREVVYVDGQNDGKMVVLEAGFKRLLGKMNLDPNGTLAMNGQKHPITDVGIRNLTAKLIKMWEAETQVRRMRSHDEARHQDRTAARRRWFRSFTPCRDRTSSSTSPGCSSTTN